MITKKHSSLFAVAAACLLAGGFISQASANTNMLVLGYGNRHSGNGGEFNASSTDFTPLGLGYSSAATFGSGFETFCVEENEFFTPGGTYFYDMSQTAINGGIAGGNPDPLSQGAAWVYLQFATNNLAGYDYTVGPGGDASAGDLQEAIWWLENEISTQNFSNPFENLVVSQFGTAANAMLDNNGNGNYGVSVLNLWADAAHTQLAQDQLVLSPGPGQQTVPDGGTTAALLGLGLLGLFFAGRRASRLKTAAI